MYEIQSDNTHDSDDATDVWDLCRRGNIHDFKIKSIITPT